MSLRENAVKEFRRSPITVAATVIGVTVATLSLLIAWSQNDGQLPTSISTEFDAVSQPNLLSLKNLFILTAFFFASTFSIASLIRLVARLHSFAAFVLSVPAAVLTSFSSLVVLNLVPPRALDATAQAAAIDSIHYGTVAIFVAINGLPILRLFFGAFVENSDESKNSTTSGYDGMFILILILFLLFMWSNLVSTGLSRLVTTFLA